TTTPTPAAPASETDLASATRLREADARWKTHAVHNQVPPLEDWNVFSSHTALVEAVEREGASWVRPRAEQLGRLIAGEPQQWGELANENRPVLHTHDRYG